MIGTQEIFAANRPELESRCALTSQGEVGPLRMTFMGHWLEGGKLAVSMCWAGGRRAQEQQKDPQPVKLASLPRSEVNCGLRHSRAAL